MSQPDIRRLLPADAPAYRTLLLAALHDHPAAFSASHAEESAVPPETVATRLATAEIFGTFGNGDLRGFVTLQRSPLLKRRHVGHIAGMFVTAAARGTGTARTLFAAVLAHAAEHVDQIELFVACGNAHARRFYEGFGFTPYGRMQRALRVGDEDHDADMMVLRFR